MSRASKRCWRVTGLVGVVAVLIAGSASAVNFTFVDLNQFTADPADRVTMISGTSAWMQEDIDVDPVVLYHTGLQMPANAVVLDFEYYLCVMTFDENYFDFYFGDLSTPIFSTGGYVGNYEGLFSMNVAAYAGLEVPIMFSLAAGLDDEDWAADLAIRDLRIGTRDASVPDGGATLALLLTALGGMWCVRRRGARG